MAVPERRTLVVLGSLIGAMTLASGCAKPLFPQGTPRSPYERYMALRGQHAPAKEINAFGRTQPALRERLRPLGK